MMAWTVVAGLYLLGVYQAYLMTLMAREMPAHSGVFGGDRRVEKVAVVMACVGWPVVMVWLAVDVTLSSARGKW